MKYMVTIALLASACQADHPACKASSDCHPGQVCDLYGVCYTPPIDASIEGDAAVPADAAVDAAPDVQTFPVGFDCGGGHCEGGYNGQKDATGPANSAWLCAKLGFPRWLSFTISSSRPGGRFCTWTAVAMQFVCDPSCSGCNPIDSVTCSNP